MVGNLKKQPQLLITPEEALRLGDFGTVGTIDFVRTVAKLYDIKNSGEHKGQWYFSCLASILFDAGRIQGIREERERRRT